MREVILPRLGVTMEYGVIEKWHKQEGERVEAGEVLFELTTDKATQEIEAEASGTVLKILRHEGEEVPVAEVIAYLGEPGETIPDSETAAPPAAEEDAALAIESRKISVETVTNGDKRRLKISPYARKLAIEKRVPIENVRGTGPGGRTKARDVLAYASQSMAATETAVRSQAGRAPSVAHSMQLVGLRKIIAEKMARAKSTIPHVTLNAVIDVSEMRAYCRQVKSETIHAHAGVTLTDCLLKIIALALRENPSLNAEFVDGIHRVFNDINLGLAVAADAGLNVVTLYECDRLDLLEIAAQRVPLVERARRGRLALRDISNATFTVTNLGMYGVRSFAPIINPPQVGILGVGEVYESPVLVDNTLTNRAFVEFSLACDHRVVDGAHAALFLQRLRDLAQRPRYLFAGERQ